MDFSILVNASLTVLDETTSAGLVTRSKEIAAAKPFLDRLRLRYSSFDQPVSSLFGRQPAEGRSFQMAGDQTQGSHPGRADPGHRRSDQGRRSRDDGRSRQQRHGHHSHFLGTARTAGHVRPDDRSAEGDVVAELKRGEVSQETVIGAGDGPPQERRRDMPPASWRRSKRMPIVVPHPSSGMTFWRAAKSGCLPRLPR